MVLHLDLCKFAGLCCFFFQNVFWMSAESSCFTCVACTTGFAFVPIQSFVQALVSVKFEYVNRPDHMDRKAEGPKKTAVHVHLTIGICAEDFCMKIWQSSTGNATSLRVLHDDEFNFICLRLMSSTRRTRACKKTKIHFCNLQSWTDKSPLFRPSCGVKRSEL